MSDETRPDIPLDLLRCLNLTRGEPVTNIDADPGPDCHAAWVTLHGSTPMAIQGQRRPEGVGVTVWKAWLVREDGNAFSCEPAAVYAGHLSEDDVQTLRSRRAFGGGSGSA